MIHEPKPIDAGLQLLAALEEALKAADLWSLNRPTPEALASTQPFACDTLAFEQWLQFIFIPRLQAIFERGSMPPAMQILPMAEVTWPGDHQPVHLVLARFDCWSKSVHGE